MQLTEAIELIRFQPSAIKKQVWADLGCGDGLFTRALASFLPKESMIHAVDNDGKALAKIPENFNGIMINKSLSDFLVEDVFFPRLDGLLMANSLHFIPNKQSFLRAKFDILKDNGLFLLVEYDLKTSNQWVPYPLTMDEAQLLVMDVGFKSFEVLRKKPSVYGRHFMYAALIKK